MNISLNKVQQNSLTLLISIISLTMGMGVDMHVPSLPKMTEYFHTNSAIIQQTIGFYILANGIGQFTWGILSDFVGRKKIILFGSAFTFVTSILAAFSPNVYCLIILRFFQGLSIASLPVGIRAIATDCFSGKELLKTITYYAIFWALGPIIGPLIGGYLQHFFNWQANFYFFALFASIIFIFIFLVIPETNMNSESFQLKKAIAVVKNIISHPIYLTGAFLLAFAYAILLLFNLVGPFLIQNTLKYSVIINGHIAFFLGFGYFSSAFLNRFLIHYHKPLNIVFFAMILGLLSSFTMLLCGLLLPLSLYIILPFVFSMLFCCGFTFPNIMTELIMLFPKQAGAANAVYSIIILPGGFLLTPFIGLLKTNSQIPMSCTYIILFLICLSLLLFIKKLTYRI